MKRTISKTSYPLHWITSHTTLDRCFHHRRFNVDTNEMKQKLREEQEMRLAGPDHRNQPQRWCLHLEKQRTIERHKELIRGE